MACDLLGPSSAAHFCFIKISPPETLSTAFLEAVLWQSLSHCYEVVCQEEITAIKI